MAYSESLARRIRHVCAGRRSMTEKKMFGGVGFLLHGNMCVGIWKDSLIVRVGSDNYQDALTQPHVREFDITGRPMNGWVMVEPDGIESDESLNEWIRQAEDFVTTLPRK